MMSLKKGLMVMGCITVFALSGQPSQCNIGTQYSELSERAVGNKYCAITTTYVRAGAGYDNEVLGVISEGEYIYVRKIVDNWGMVVYSGMTGYVNMDDMKKI